jgi:hypothetical protein
MVTKRRFLPPRKTHYISATKPNRLMLFGEKVTVYCEHYKFEVTLQLTVSQYVLVSSTLVRLATRYYFLSECFCLKFAVLFLWGALSDERTGLQYFEVRSYFTTDSQSVSMSWYRVPLWDLRPDITSCRNVSV